MGSCSYIDTCPKCESQDMCHTSHTRSYEVSGECLNCGFYYYTQEGQMDLNLLNELRKYNDIEELKEIQKIEGGCLKCKN